MPKVADLFPSRHTLRDLFQKSESAVAAAVPHDKIAGSFEHFVDKVSEPVKGAVPHTDGEKSKHYPHVKATFGDHAIVGCNDCGKTWHVPFGLGGDDKVIVGSPSEREEAYVEPGSLDGDGDGDSGGGEGEIGRAHV